MSKLEHEKKTSELFNLIYLKCPYCGDIEKWPNISTFSEYFARPNSDVPAFPALPDGKVLLEHKRCGRVIVLSHEESRMLYPAWVDLIKDLANRKRKTEDVS
jgi:hypothetical protein